MRAFEIGAVSAGRYSYGNIDPEKAAGRAVRPRIDQFMEVYFDQLHHLMEEDGVDFWWIDWQQGGLTRQGRPRPAVGLNHLHYLDSARNGRQRLQRTQPASAHLLRYAGPAAPLPDRFPPGDTSTVDVEFAGVPAGIHRLRSTSAAGGATTSAATCSVTDEELEVRCTSWARVQSGSTVCIHRFAVRDGKEP